MARLAVVFATFLATLAALVGLAAATRFDEAVARGRSEHAHRALAAEIAPADRPLVVWLGDSTLLSSKAARSYPSRIARELRPAVATSVTPLIGGGLWEAYFLADRVLAARPALVVLIANLRSLPPAAHLPNYHDLACWIPTAELPTALSLPLHEIRMSLPRLLLFRALRIPALERLVYFATGLRGEIASSPVGGLLVPEPSLFEMDAIEVRARHFAYYDAPIRSHQGSVRALDALLDLLARNGVPAIVVVSPIPVQTLRRAGRYDAAVMGERLSVLRAVADARGATFVDLHDRLGPDGFRDHLGHFSEAGSAKLARVVGRHVVATLETDGVVVPTARRRQRPAE